MGAHNLQQKLNIVSVIHLDVIGYAAIFLIFFPKFFVETVIVKVTSDALVQPLSMSEFLRFIGIWLVITYDNPGNLNQRELWSKDTVSREIGAPLRLNDLISSNRFEEIIKYLTCTSAGPPPLKEPCWEVREIIKSLWLQFLQVVGSHVWINPCQYVPINGRAPVGCSVPGSLI